MFFILYAVYAPAKTVVILTIIVLAVVAGVVMEIKK